MTIHDKGLSRSVYLRARGTEAHYERLPRHPLVQRFVARAMPRRHLPTMVQRAAQSVPVLTSQLEVERIFDHDPRSFWGLWRQGESEDTVPGGLTAFLLLSDHGLQRLLDGTLDFQNPQSAALVARDDPPKALYIWLMYAPGRISGALFSLFEAFNAWPYANADIYWRPVTPGGRRLTQPFGFELADTQARIPNLYKIARAPVAAEAAKLPDGPRRTLNGAKRSNVTVSVARSVDDIMRAVAIRAAVFMAEQDCPYHEEFDGNDFCATHLVASVDGEPAACIQLRFFGNFAKIERMAVRKEFRKSRAIFRLIGFTLAFCRRKGFEKVYGHVQERLLGFWTHFGATAMPERQRLAFSDHTYIEMVVELGKGENALLLGCDPHVLNRPEGVWDEPGILERSAARGGECRQG